MRYVLKLVVLGLICLTGMGMKKFEVKQVDETTFPLRSEAGVVADAYTPSVVCAIDIVSPEFEQQDNNRVKLTYSILAVENVLRTLERQFGAESNLIPGGELYDWSAKGDLEERFTKRTELKLTSPNFRSGKATTATE